MGGKSVDVDKVMDSDRVLDLYIKECQRFQVAVDAGMGSGQ